MPALLITSNNSQSSDVGDFYIPNLLKMWPWIQKVNPLSQEVQNSSSEWFRSFQLYPNEKQQKQHESLDLGKLAAYIYPLGDENIVRLSAEYSNCIIWFDGYSDNALPEDIQRTTRSIIRALENSEEFNASNKEQFPGLELHQDFWRRLNMAYPRSKSTQLRFIRQCQKYFSAIEQEAIDRRDYIIRNTDSYFSVRRDTIGIRPGFSLLALALDLPDSVLDHPYIESLSDAAVDMIIIGNDAYSWNVEQARGDDAHNLVTIVMKEYDMGIQEAMDYVDEVHQRVLDNFLELWANPPTWDIDLQSRVEQYIDGLAGWVTGCDTWSAESGRYGLSEAFFESRRVQLMQAKI